MRIGVLGSFYECAELLPQVLTPWKDLKESGFPIEIAAVNAQFKEYADLGYQNDDESTRVVIEQHKELFDFVHIAKVPLLEKDVRNIGLQYLLSKKVDLIWILDGDEIYTEQEIKGILDRVAQTPQFDYYHIYFDNRIFETIRSGDDFFPPRIFRTDRNLGIREFSWDNEIVFNDGSGLSGRVPGIIPKSIAHVLHHTWRKKDALKKVRYQERHFGYSMFRFDEPSGKFTFNEQYFLHHMMPIPRMEGTDTILAAKKPVLDVILRTHSSGNVHGDVPRVTDRLGDKEELIVRSLRSLVYSLLILERSNVATIRLTVIDDHSSGSCLLRINEILSLCPFGATLINLETSGNGASLYACFDHARKHAEDLIYFVEDDYLHERSALEEMFLSFRHFAKNTGREDVALFPVDYSDFYLPNMIAPTRVVKGTRRHWRLSFSTTCTFFIPKLVLDRHFSAFELLSKNGVVEATSINPIWQKEVLLFSPIPTLAIHMHNEELLPPFSNWKRLWDENAA